MVSSFQSRAASYMAENAISVQKVGVCSTYGVFHGKSTSAHYPSTWNFLETWYIGYSGAQKPNLAILHPSERWLTSYGNGYFCIVVQQYYLLHLYNILGTYM